MTTYDIFPPPWDVTPPTRVLWRGFAGYPALPGGLAGAGRPGELGRGFQRFAGLDLCAPTGDCR